MLLSQITRFNFGKSLFSFGAEVDSEGPRNGETFNMFICFPECLTFFHAQATFCYSTEALANVFENSETFFASRK